MSTDVGVAPVGEALLSPELPYDMRTRAERAARDVRLRQLVEAATENKFRGRVDSCRAAFGDR